jgi:protein SCO1/2
MQPIRRSFLVSLAALLAAPGSVLAHEKHAPAPARAGAGASTIRLDLPDAPLVDHDGRAVRLRTDVLAGRIVVVDFIYTTCTTICPIYSATMAELQRRLGPRAGRDVQLVTVTVDPLRDTPRRLKEYASRHTDRMDGWAFLTGTKPNVDAVNKGFGAYTPNIDDHPPMVIVGDAGSGEWTRFYGFPGVPALERRVHDLLDARARHS